MKGDTKKQDAKGALSHEDKQQLLQMSEISLWLDTYDDIFSDFDPRPYSQRGLSQDFLGEAQRASRDKASGEIELKLLIPASKRSVGQEIMIRKRLREHFRKHLNLVRREFKKTIRRGFLFTVFGILLMFIATYVLFEYSGASLFTSFLIVFLEPAGWFLFWTGLDLIMFESKKIKPDLEFYEKMSKCEIRFLSY
jgi:hypothetical protein